jgi:hypothetical protein
MGCGCGKKAQVAPRSSSNGIARPMPAARPSPSAAARPPAVAPLATSRMARQGALQAALIIRYLGDVPITVRGVATGALYRFAARGQVVSVDRRDTGALLATRQFVSV